MEKNQSTALLFEMSKPGRRCARLPECDVPVTADAIPARFLADAPPPLPELGELDVVRHFVNLSTKKLVTLSKVITKDGSAITVQLGNAKVSGGTLRVKAGSGGPAGGGWQFKIPSAVVYKSISFRINAAAHLSAPPSQIAIQNFNTCTDWNTSCFDRWKGIGSTSGARKWYTTSGALSSHRKGHVVRGIVYVPQGTVYVYKAEVKVTYQILK